MRVPSQAAPELTVVFSRVTLSQDFTRAMVQLSRRVTHRNGNTTWNAQLKLITDDVDLAFRALNAFDRRYERRAAQRFSDNAGVCWPDSGVIWISGATSSYYLPRLLAHEVAHALASDAHGERWRRIYALLFPLWHSAIERYVDIPSLDSSSVFNECRRIINTYSHYATRQRTVREITQLDRMAHQSRDLWLDDVQLITDR